MLFFALLSMNILVSSYRTDATAASVLTSQGAGIGAFKQTVSPLAVCHVVAAGIM